MALAITAAGAVHVGYGAECETLLRVAAWSRDAVVHRGTVADLGPGWKGQSLPLDAANDDETPPFPATATVPATVTDGLAPAGPLILYRVLSDGQPSGNRLRLVPRGSGAVELSF